MHGSDLAIDMPQRFSISFTQPSDASSPTFSFFAPLTAPLFETPRGSSLLTDRMLANVKKFGYPDMSLMDSMTVEDVLSNIRMRSVQDLVYTNVSDILISVNPYKSIPNLYGREMYEDYAYQRSNSQIASLPPHLFGVARRVLSGAVGNGQERQNQAVLISGESGAGKTEATKLILKYLIYMCSKQVEKSRFVEQAIGDDLGDDLEDRVIMTNPILEAFGNAKTLRNDNSSRFGKWMSVQIDTRPIVVGAKITQYLLEGSRVTYQATGERNYNIFYQVCAGAGETYNAEKFHYLNQSGCTKINHIDDLKAFNQLTEALRCLAIDQPERISIYTIVKGILHLGNISFTASESMKDAIKIAPACADDLKMASQMLGFSNVADLDRLLCTQLIMYGRGTMITKHRTIPHAVATRDSIAKYVYSGLFTYIVNRINDAISVEVHKDVSTIGILDIFGFENFQTNSLEQLCINYANEKLQHYFLDFLTVKEMEEYKTGGITIQEAVFDLSTKCLDLLEQKGTGIFMVLTDVVSLPNSSDQMFLDSIYKIHDKHPHFSKPRGNSPNFTIIHYAQPVLYDGIGFLEKSRSKISDDVTDCFRSSQSTVIQAIFTAVEAPDELTTKVKTKKEKSTGDLFRNSLSDLLNSLRTTVPHFVRCLKPNETQQPDTFNDEMVLRQLQTSGVLDAVMVRKIGYSERIYFKRFVQQNGMLIISKFASSPPELIAKYKAAAASYKSMCDIILSHFCKFNFLESPIPQWQLGNSKVYAKTATLAILDYRKQVIRDVAVTHIQKRLRGKRARAIVKQQKHLMGEIRRYLEKKDWSSFDKAFKAALDWGVDEKRLAPVTKERLVILETDKLESGLLNAVITTAECPTVAMRLQKLVEAVEYAADEASCNSLPVAEQIKVVVTAMKSSGTINRVTKFSILPVVYALFDTWTALAVLMKTMDDARAKLKTGTNDLHSLYVKQLVTTAHISIQESWSPVENRLKNAVKEIINAFRVQSLLGNDEVRYLANLIEKGIQKTNMLDRIAALSTTVIVKSAKEFLDECRELFLGAAEMDIEENVLDKVWKHSEEARFRNALEDALKQQPPHTPLYSSTELLSQIVADVTQAEATKQIVLTGQAVELVAKAKVMVMKVENIDEIEKLLDLTQRFETEPVGVITSWLVLVSDLQVKEGGCLSSEPSAKQLMVDFKNRKDAMVARIESIEADRREAIRKAQEEKARRDTEEKARVEAEEKAKREAEEQRIAEEKVAAAERLRLEKEEVARKEMDRIQAQDEAARLALQSETARKELEKRNEAAKEAARLDLQARQAQEQKERKEAEEKARREAEAQRAAQEKSKAEEVERLHLAKLEAERKEAERARQEAETKAKEETQREEQEARRLEAIKQEKELKQKLELQRQEEALKKATEEKEKLVQEAKKLKADQEEKETLMVVARRPKTNSICGTLTLRRLPSTSIEKDSESTSEQSSQSIAAVVKKSQLSLETEYKLMYAKEKVKLLENYQTYLRRMYLSSRRTCFGGELEKCLELSPYPVPFVVYDTIEYLRANGLKAEGLFRIPGRHEQIMKLIDAYSQVDPVVLNDIHDAGGVLKRFFGLMAPPLIPYDMYKSFVEIGKELIRNSENGDDAETEAGRQVQLENLRMLFDRFPSANLELFVYLCQFLSEVAACSNVNKMDCNNLALVFCPNLLQSPTQDPNVLAFDAKASQVVLASCIAAHEDLFDIGAIRQGRTNKTAPRHSTASDRSFEMHKMYVLEDILADPALEQNLLPEQTLMLKSHAPRKQGPGKLCFTVHGCENLGVDNPKACSAYVTITCTNTYTGDCDYSTVVSQNNVSPVYNFAKKFKIPNPWRSVIRFVVRDHITRKTMGEIAFMVSDIASVKDGNKRGTKHVRAVFALKNTKRGTIDISVRYHSEGDGLFGKARLPEIVEKNAYKRNPFLRHK